MRAVGRRPWRLVWMNEDGFFASFIYTTCSIDMDSAVIHKTPGQSRGRPAELGTWCPCRRCDTDDESGWEISEPAIRRLGPENRRSGALAEELHVVNVGLT